MFRQNRFHTGQCLTTVMFIALLSFVATAQQPSTGQSDATWKAVEGAMGRGGDVQPDGVLKFSMPRKDLKVSIAGMQVKAGLALGSWAAFKKMGSQAMLMGDLVLTEDEVSPVMRKLLDGGVEVTALHKHVLHESPRVMYMHIGGMEAVMTIESATDGEVFGAYVEQVLCPKLNPGDVVILDNLSAHKVPGIREMIEARGAELLYLPPYSPDLNPIEKAWFKLKQFPRAAKARSAEALDPAIAEALKTITADNAAAWFHHCGYALHN